jgi:AbrB family looped-hinge helix DNA binding protein
MDEHRKKSVVRVSAKGQIVIPQGVRRRLGIKAGTKLRLELSDDRIELSPLPQDLIGYLCGVVKKEHSLSQLLLREREADRDREEEKATRFTRGSKVPAKRKRG